MENVHITGLGIVSSLGINVNENLKCLLEGKSGVTKKNVSLLNEGFPLGSVYYENSWFEKNFNLSDNVYPRSALFAIKAAEEAIIDSGIQQFINSDVAVITGSTTGGIDKTEKYYSEYKKPQSFYKSYNYGLTSELISEYFGFNNFVATISTACSSSANAISFGADLIKSGKYKRVIVGGTDAISLYTINGFKSLFILSKEQCRPFDRDRDGLNIGEGAAYLVLEAESALNGRRSYCLLSGYANANDAFHSTASSEEGEGPFKAMGEAIKMAGLKPENIDYVNVHGTATPNNDLTEGNAMKRLFAGKIPHFSSSKPFTGHTLGAAGAIEAVFSVLALENSFIIPSLNYENPILEHNLIPTSKIEKGLKIENVLSNSFGFGGNDTSLVFSKIDKH